MARRGAGARELDRSTATEPGLGLRLFKVLWDEWTFGRKVDRELDADTWEIFRAAARRRYPDRPELWGDTRPISRANYNDFQRTHVDRTDLVTEVSSTMERVATASTIELGLCDPGGGGSLTHPSPNRVLAADGKVIEPRRRRRKNKDGDVISEGNLEAGPFRTGAGEKVIGLRYVIAATRGDDPNQRIISGVEPAPLAGGEMVHAVRLLDRLLAQLPGTQVVVYDGAARGTHVEHLQTQHGVIALARLNNAHGDKVVERPYGNATARRPDGSEVSVELFLRDGAPHLVELDEDGTPVLTPLVRTKVHQRKRLDGRYCWYVDWALPEHRGGGTVMLRHDQTSKDIADGFNRAEHLRIIPPSDPDYDRLYGRRNDTESGHRVLDDSLWRERAPHLGMRRNWWHLICHAAYLNAQALALARRRAALPAAA